MALMGRCRRLSYQRHSLCMWWNPHQRLCPLRKLRNPSPRCCRPLRRRRTSLTQVKPQGKELQQFHRTALGRKVVLPPEFLRQSYLV